VNRQILQYGYPITAVILLIFAWVVAQRLARGVDTIIPLAVAAVIVWLLGTFVFIYFWPQITVMPGASVRVSPTNGPNACGL